MGIVKLAKNVKCHCDLKSDETCVMVIVGGLVLADIGDDFSKNILKKRRNFVENSRLNSRSILLKIEMPLNSRYIRPRG